MPNHSPSHSRERIKRLRLDDSDSDEEVEGPAFLPPAVSSHTDSESEDQCVICLQVVVDRSILPGCAHDKFCFECIEMWASQSRKCPLCTATIGNYLIHNIRSKYDFSKYHLPPLRTSPPSPAQLSNRNTGRRPPNRGPQVEWGRSRRENQGELDRAIDKRRWIYRHDLFAKHVASNSYTRYRPFPTPAQFAASADLISRATAFIRRELQVWRNLDVEFLTSFTLALMKSVDIRSESAVKLLSEFLDMEVPYSEGHRFKNAEHFAHELYCYLRSPYRDLAIYDTVVQYDKPSDVPPPPSRRRFNRWVTASPSRSRSRSVSDRRPSSRRDSSSPRRSSSASLYSLEGSPREFNLTLSPESQAPRRRRRSLSRSRSRSSSRSKAIDRKGKRVVRRGATPRMTDDHRGDGHPKRRRETNAQIEPAPSGEDKRWPVDVEPPTSSRSQTSSEITPDSAPNQGTTQPPCLGIRIKGAGLAVPATGQTTKKLSEGASDIVEGDHMDKFDDPELLLPSLLRRMSDAPEGLDLRVVNAEINPSVSDIMRSTRAHISARRNGYNRSLYSTMDLPEVPVGTERRPSMDANRRAQLMARLEEERSRFKDDPDVPPEVPTGALHLAPDSVEATEAKLRLKALLRFKLSAERAKVATQSPEHGLSASATQQEDGLREQLRRRQSFHQT